MFSSENKRSKSMESPGCSDFHRSTPEPSGPPNDSGYLTATPSPLSSEVSDSTSKVLCTNGPSANIHFSDTPVVTKKGNLRKKLLERSLSKHPEETEDSDIVGESEESDQCVPKGCEVNSSGDPVLSDDNSLLDNFCGLHVEESDTTESYSVIAKSSTRKLSPDFDSYKGPFSSPPKLKRSKLGLPLDRLCTKKFRSNDIGLSTCLQSTTGNRLCSLISVRKLDFFVQLGEVRSLPGVLSTILSYLPPQDLVTVCKVSRPWRRICVADPTSNLRRLAFLRHYKQTKENISLNDFKQTDQGLLPLQKEVFREIQNVNRRASSSSSSSTPRSPPVSPSKVRFHRFFKLGGTLGEGAQLLPCPRCSWPSCTEPGLQQACCQAVGCQYIFCPKCHCDAHGGMPCFAQGAAGLPRRSKATCVGSKQSRRNLRRL